MDICVYFCIYIIPIIDKNTQITIFSSWNVCHHTREKTFVIRPFPFAYIWLVNITYTVTPEVISIFRAIQCHIIVARLNMLVMDMLWTIFLKKEKLCCVSCRSKFSIIWCGWSSDGQDFILFEKIFFHTPIYAVNIKPIILPVVPHRSNLRFQMYPRSTIWSSTEPNISKRELEVTYSHFKKEMIAYTCKQNKNNDKHSPWCQTYRSCIVEDNVSIRWTNIYQASGTSKVSKAMWIIRWKILKYPYTIPWIRIQFIQRTYMVTSSIKYSKRRSSSEASQAWWWAIEQLYIHSLCIHS